MQLIVYCKKCSTRNSLKIKASDRVELKMKYGDKINLTCRKCNTKDTYEVNEIKAEQRIAPLISFVAVFIFMILIIYFLWDYAKHQLSSLYLLPIGVFIALIIYVVLTKEINNRVRNFNRS